MMIASPLHPNPSLTAFKIARCALLQLGPLFTLLCITPFAATIGAAAQTVTPQDSPANLVAPDTKPRIINTTDLGADPDDEQSMVRQLVCANEFDIEGLIVTTGCWKKEQSNTHQLDKIVDAYGQCVNNLSKHAPGFPSHAYLKSVSVMGQRDYGMNDVGSGKDSPGSDLIIAAVDRDDPRPVWIACWGGANTVAQALWKVRETRSPQALTQFIAKMRVFDVLGQDDAGAWIAKTFPDLLYIRATAVYGWAPSDEYLQQHIQSHGPLGAVYPNRKYATEGDSPAFMYLHPTGLNDPEHVDHGSWGGRFDQTKKCGIRSMEPVQNEAMYDPYFMYGNSAEGSRAIQRWSTSYNNDFAARMDWSITSEYAEANHHPVAILNGDRSRRVLEMTAPAENNLTVSAEGSYDPDRDQLTYNWAFYQEPSSYQGNLQLDHPLDPTSPTTTVRIPPEASGKDIHLTLEVRDNGQPELSAFRRLLIHVE